MLDFIRPRFGGDVELPALPEHDPVRLEHVRDRGRGHSMSERLELALDPAVAPARVKLLSEHRGEDVVLTRPVQPEVLRECSLGASPKPIELSIPDEILDTESAWIEGISGGRRDGR